MLPARPADPVAPVTSVNPSSVNSRFQEASTAAGSCRQRSYAHSMASRLQALRIESAISPGRMQRVYRLRVYWHSEGRAENAWGRVCLSVLWDTSHNLLSAQMLRKNNSSHRFVPGRNCWDKWGTNRRDFS